MRRSNVFVIGSFLNHAIRLSAKTASRLTFGTYVPVPDCLCILCTSVNEMYAGYTSRTGGAPRSSFSCVKVERREPEGLGLYTWKRGRTMKRLREEIQVEAITRSRSIQFLLVTHIDALLFRPIFDIQAVYSLEVFLIVRHQYQIVSERRCSDQQIHIGDNISLLL